MKKHPYKAIKQNELRFYTKPVLFLITNYDDTNLDGVNLLLGRVKLPHYRVNGYAEISTWLVKYSRIQLPNKSELDLKCGFENHQNQRYRNPVLAAYYHLSCQMLLQSY